MIIGKVQIPAMERKEYSAGAVKLSFWFMEFRKVVGLLNEGKTIDEIKQMNKDQNIFGAPTADRSEKIFNTVAARIGCLAPTFYSVFLNSDISTQKLFALAAAMANDTLFFDFVFEVIREKMIIGSNEFADSDLRIFFKNKQVQDEKVAGWTDATIKRLSGSYKTMLFEAGMTDHGKTVRIINRPILDPILLMRTPSATCVLIICTAWSACMRAKLPGCRISSTTAAMAAK